MMPARLNLSPEERHEHLKACKRRWMTETEKGRAYAEKLKLKKRAYRRKRDDATRERARVKRAEYRKTEAGKATMRRWNSSEGSREAQRRYRLSKSGRASIAAQMGPQLFGMTVATDDRGCDLLQRLNDLVPRYLSAADRHDLIGEAALIVLERGVSEAEAVKMARKTALAPYQMQRAVPLHDAYWL